MRDSIAPRCSSTASDDTGFAHLLGPLLHEAIKRGDKLVVGLLVRGTAFAPVRRGAARHAGFVAHLSHREACGLYLLLQIIMQIHSWVLVWSNSTAKSRIVTLLPDQ